jgi:hypothetical protein
VVTRAGDQPCFIHCVRGFSLTPVIGFALAITRAPAGIEVLELI